MRRLAEWVLGAAVVVLWLGVSLDVDSRAQDPAAGDAAALPTGVAPDAAPLNARRDGREPVRGPGPVPTTSD